MMELALRAKKAEIYTVETLCENFYLIDDLKPDLIIFDLDQNSADLLKLYEYSKQTRLVATGPAGYEDSLDSRVKGFLPKPIIAHNLAERVLSLIE
ncbi:MAG: hypothetical protein H7336_09405 [Bacteriovorax sp.]|nr:hypothetical protein [Bacteriovorax sp.]